MDKNQEVRHFRSRAGGGLYLAIYAALTCAACLCARTSVAENWQIDPRFQVGAQTDDNYLLLPVNNTSSVSGGFGDVRVDLRSIGQINSFRFTPGVHATFYPNHAVDQSTDPYAEFEVNHQGEKVAANLNGSYMKESDLKFDRATNDPAGGGLGNPVGGDSGYLTIHNRVQMINVTPSANVTLTPRDHLELAANYMLAKYDQVIPGSNVGYTDIAASIGYGYDLTPRDTFTIRAMVGRNDPDGPANATDSYGLQANWSRHVSESAQVYARVGAERFKYDQVSTGGSSKSTSVIAGAGVNWTFQVSQLFVDLTRTVDPSAAGLSVERDQIRLRFNRSLTPKTLVYAGARALRDNAADSRPNFNKRTYAIGTVGIEWRPLRAWSVTGEYNFTHQKFTNDLQAARSNTFMLSLVYEPHREVASVGRYRGR